MNPTGKHLRDTEIDRVMEPEGSWRDRYKAILIDWFAGRPEGFRFTGETLRQVAKDHGLSEPHHHNAWSGSAASLIRGWLKDEKIFITGVYVLASSPKTHAHALRQYEKVTTRRYTARKNESQLAMEGL